MGSHLEYEADSETEGRKVLYIGISIGLTVLAGLMSGLTLGLMSLDHVDLQVMLRLSEYQSTACLRNTFWDLPRVRVISLAEQYCIDLLAGVGAQRDRDRKEARGKGGAGAQQA